jgi:hypothetical protein
MQAPKPGSSETLRLEAADARADGRRRTISISGDLVVIARHRDGVYMRIALPPEAFRGVLLRLVGLDDGEFRYEALLAHSDPELSVALAASTDRRETEESWKSWAHFLGAPALVEREGGAEEEVFIPGRPASTDFAPQRRNSGVGARRPRFLARRQVGAPPAGRQSETAVRELFGAWSDGV